MHITLCLDICQKKALLNVLYYIIHILVASFLSKNKIEKKKISVTVRMSITFILWYDYVCVTYKVSVRYPLFLTYL